MPPPEDRRRHTDKIGQELKDYIRAEFADHEARERRAYRELFDQAFPEGDLAGHRAYHEARIEAAKAEEEFWRVAKETLIKKGVTSLVWLVGVIASLAVLGLAVNLGLPVAGLVQGKVP